MILSKIYFFLLWKIGTSETNLRRTLKNVNANSVKVGHQTMLTRRTHDLSNQLSDLQYDTDPSFAFWGERYKNKRRKGSVILSVKAVRDKMNKWSNKDQLMFTPNFDKKFPRKNFSDEIEPVALEKCEIGNRQFIKNSL